VVCDNYATHKRQNVKDWLAANPGSPCTSHPRAVPG
jgi:hypothetical protein